MDRSDQRRAPDRAILGTFVAGAGLQLAIALATLASLPFVTRSLSPAEFGVFATLTGFGALLSFADLGIGGALATRLAETRGRGDLEASTSAVSTAFVASCLAGALTWITLTLSVWFLPWQRLLGAHQVDRAEVSHAVLAMAIAIGLAVPASIGQRMLYGVHRGGLANAYLLLGALLSGGLMILGAAMGWPMYAYLLTALGMPTLAGFACGVSVVMKHAPYLRPRVRAASLQEWRTLRSPSSWYFAIAVAAAVSFQADALIVSSILGAATAGVFALAVRLFGLISASLTPALLQLWPAFGEAFVRGDREWIVSRLVWSTAMGVAISAGAGLVVVAAGPPLIGALFTDALVPARGLLLALTCWTTYSFVTAPSYLLLNATGRVRVHGWVAIAVGVVNLPLSLVLTHAIGVSGPAWGSLIASVLLTAVPGFLAVRSVLAELTSVSS